jgi:hypothetical protein
MHNLGKQILYIRKPDLDTITSAFLLNINQNTHQLCLTAEEAPFEVLANRDVVCLECGGSGQTEALNFDHHETGLSLPTAVEQVWEHLGQNSIFSQLVNYVAWVDSGGLRGSCPCVGRGDEPRATLSAFTSGLFLLVPDLQRRFWLGLELVEQVWLSGLPPWDLSAGLLERELWSKYFQAKISAARELDLLRPEVVELHGNPKVLALSSEHYGAHGLLRKMGAAVRVAHRPSDGQITVSVDELHRLWLDNLKMALNYQEPGWGGPSGGTILASPFAGTRFDFKIFCQFIINYIIKA